MKKKKPIDGDKIRKLFKEGMSKRQIAKVMKTGRSNVYHHLGYKHGARYKGTVK